MKRVVVVGALAGFAAACGIVNGLTLGTVANDGGLDGSDAEAGIVDPCNHEYPPGPPPGPVLGGGSVFVTALRTIALGTHPDGGAYDRIGYDLDRTCSCQNAVGPSCIAPKSAGPDAGCDQAGGTDNAATPLFQNAIDLSQGTITLEEDLSGALNAGAPGVLLWVGKYNGEANDPDVSVGVLISPGVEAGGRPTFDAGEVWLASTSDTVPLNDNSGFVPKNFISTQTGTTYVKDNQLIAQGEITLPLLAGLTVHLSQGYLVGQISKTPEGMFYVSSGTVTGRAPLAEVIRSIGGIEKPTKSGKHLCDGDDSKNTIIFESIKQFVCAAPDIMQDPTLDNTGATCNGLSLGVRFTAVPAALGTQADPTTVTYCADADVSCP